MFRKWNRSERLHGIIKTCQCAETKNDIAIASKLVCVYRAPEGEMEALTMREKLKKLKELKKNSKGFLDLLTSCFFFKRTIAVTSYPGGLLTPAL